MAASYLIFCILFLSMVGLLKRQFILLYKVMIFEIINPIKILIIFSACAISLFIYVIKSFDINLKLLKIIIFVLGIESVFRELLLISIYIIAMIKTKT